MISRRNVLILGGAFAVTASARAATPYDPNPAYPQGTSDTRGREVISHFKPLPSAITLVVIGQSNAANTNAVTDGFVPPDGITNINPYDRKVYKAREPLLGASSGTPPFTGGFSSRLAALLLERHAAPQVNILNIAIGSTTIAEWNYGGQFHARIAWAGRTLDAVRLRPTFILQHLGEFDGASGTPAKTFAASQRGVVRSFRHAGMNCPYFIARVSRMVGLTKPENEAKVRRGQMLACDAKMKIFPGPDTDVLGQEYRGDPAHFLSSGAIKHAEMWFDVLKPFLSFSKS
jgi:hypothetical protein